MADSPSPAIVIDRTFILTWGFQFIAYALDTALWGMSMVLVLHYFRKFGRKDPVGIQTVVGILGFGGTLHAIFFAMLNFKNFVSLYGNIGAENVIPYEANVMLCLVYVVAFTAQMFYAGRIWILTKHDWRYTAPVILLGLCQFSAGIAQTVEVARVHLYSKLQALTGPISSTQSASTLACDLTITAILCVVLRRTDSAVDRMIIYALNRGAMTSLWALLQLIFFVGMPGTFVFQMFIVPSCHLYVISVCSMLISRESLRADLRGTNGIVIPMSDMERSFRSNESTTLGSGTVNISTTVSKWVDDIPDENGHKNAGNTKRTLEPQAIV
ncbi:hypothetical protein MVEN_02535400 [Mycena venus]|uniref:DUF6534 domain-containing protein n=1 Tax=Mycena venus TaxID=2733690 RepID=A0A8H6U2M1_9AGAR|nr:hypothetical protein MVEN_02535400 [Mycena venus]